MCTEMKTKHGFTCDGKGFFTICRIHKKIMPMMTPDIKNQGPLDLPQPLVFAPTHHSRRVLQTLDRLHNFT